MRPILLALALLPSLAMAQGLMVPGSSRPIFADSDGDVLHVYWNGSRLVDARGNAWTMNGTVPQVAAQGSPFLPPRAAGGPYTAANNYQGPTTLTEWAGDWSVTVVWQPATITQQVLVSKLPAAATSGWYVEQEVAGVRLAMHDGAAFRAATTANNATASGVNVFTGGKSGGTCYAKLNGGATASIGCAGYNPAAVEPIRIGRWGGGTLQALTSTIYEITASTVPYSDALHSARYQAVLARIR